MYEGQQIVEAIFRQKPDRIRRKIGNIEFDEQGVFHFVGNPDSYEGVRGILSFHAVFPDVDPLEAAVIVPADLKNGTSGGEGGTGKVRPPSETFTDLDNVSDFVRQVKTDGQAGHPEPRVQTAMGAEEGNGQGTEGAAGEHSGRGDAADSTQAGSEGDHPERSGLGSEDQVGGDFDTPPDDDDFDFS